MKRILPVVAVVALFACSDSGPVAPLAPIAPQAPDPNIVIGGTVLVTNSNDAGEGSFRKAIMQANTNPAIRNVEFLPRVSVIHLKSTVEFTGTQDLTVDGNRATLDGKWAGGTAFRTTGGGDLTVKSLTVKNAPGEGIHVEVPDGADGTIKVALLNVDINDNTGHGVLINDQDDPEGPGAGGSDASLDVLVLGSRFVRNGFSVSDRDGLRVNEGGLGNIRFTFKFSRSEGNGADGIELDERDVGDVTLDVWSAIVVRNGPLDPADLDDGFDVDEQGDGSILGTIVASSFSHNYEEGLDLNENDNGDLRVDLTLVDASFNGEEGIDYEEDDDSGDQGDLVTVMKGIRTVGNRGGDGGLKIREKETGNLDVTLMDVFSANNLGSGVFVRESNAGSSVVAISKAISNGNKFYSIVNDDGELEKFPGHGFEIRESGGGDLTATISNPKAIGNDGNGVFGDETGSGAGQVTLTNVFLFGNGLGSTGGGATFLP